MGDVQIRHVVDRHEEDAEFTGPSHTFCIEDLASERLPAFQIEVDDVLFVGTENFGGTVASHARTTTQTRWTSGHDVPFVAPTRS